MGLFGKLFEKKSCDICGAEIGLLGNKKLEDGQMCKDCTKKLSPYFSDRRSSTVEQIQEQLNYREANKAKVEAFQVTRTLGNSKKILLDEDAGLFLVTDRGRDWRDFNPDVLEFSQVTGCDMDIRESQTELYRESEDGSRESYNPPRYDTDYDFWITIHVNVPWFDEIEFRVNDSTIEQQGSAEYRDSERQANEIRELMSSVRQHARDAVTAANTPKTAKTCPMCGATTIPDESGRCEYCGGAVS